MNEQIQKYTTKHLAISLIGKAINFALFGLLLLMAANTSARGQAAGAVDTAYNGGVMYPFTAANDEKVQTITIQPDGKHIIAGYFTQVNSTGRNFIARLNADGTLDATFATGIGFNNYILAVAVQPDGKIIVGGRFDNYTNANGVTIRSRVARLNSDGTLDTNFNAGNVTGFVQALALQADGKVLIGGNFGTVNNAARSGIARLNTDGSVDMSFAPSPGIGIGINTESVRVLTLQPDGKVIVGGYFSTYNGASRNSIARINADGSLDTTFDVGMGANNGVFSAAIQPDGKIIIGGNFSQYNGATASYVARLNANGSRDTSFILGSTVQNSARASVTQITVLTDGRIYLSVYGFVSPTTGTTSDYLVRLNADGSIDTTFIAAGTTGTNAQSSLHRHAVQSDGKIVTNNVRLIFAQSQDAVLIATNMRRLNTDGSNDSAYNPILGYALGNPNRVNINDIMLQPDGKVVIGGRFTIANNAVRVFLARFNGDGTLDETFNARTDGVNDVSEIVRQPDGKILVGGLFRDINGVRSLGIARLNMDGTRDTNFNVGFGAETGGVYTIALQTDGKIIIGGDFQTFDRIPRKGIARLNADGTLDTTFNPGTGVEASVYSAALQTDGKILIAGNFTTYNGAARNRIARLNNDGSLDLTFNSNAGPDTANGRLYALNLQTEGKILVGGVFISFNGTPRSGIARLNADGTLDTSFGNSSQNFDNSVSEIYVQANGKVIVSGTFAVIEGQRRGGLARLNSNGLLDNTFGSNMYGADPVGSNSSLVPLVGMAVDEARGHIYYGAAFSTFNNIERGALVRLFIGTQQTVSTLFDFDGDGKTDVSVFRPSNGTWYLNQSQAGFTGITFGFGTDKLVPADYDGDGKTDVAVYRGGTWYLQRSLLGFTGVTFGDANDIPVPADYDGDGKADIAVFRPSNGTWYLQRSQLGFTGVAFGQNGDKPVAADYDGDGKADIAVNRNGIWYINRSQLGFYGVQFGDSNDKLVPADYDGDGKTDIAVFRPSNGVWYLQQSTAGFTGIAFGLGTDIPTAADYDGDGKADVAVFRNGTWYLQRSSQGFTGVAFGAATDHPVPNVFVR